MTTDRLVLVAAALLAISGVPGLFLDRRSMCGQNIATLLASIASIIGLAGVLSYAWADAPVRSSLPWSIMGAAMSVHIDALSIVFLVPVLAMSGLGPIYGMGYWRQDEHAANGRKLRLFYGLLSASMVLVIIAHSGILFLLAWEVMALSAFFLVTTEDDDPHVRRAGWIYIVTTHVGTLCLFAMFAMMHITTGSFALQPLESATGGFGSVAWIFILGGVAFGIKAGVMPLHVWLPSAHANAPSHVSAMLSGVVLKIGVYGLVRLCSLLPSPPVSWGVAVLALGAISAVVGVAFALAQHDLKRLLAYHSIENIGIIVMGLGLAMLGRAMDRPDWVVLGLAGALLHVWNHALFKSLLFFGAGSVIHAIRTREIDRMGGLARRMPMTALLFTIGAVAICGLPPLNGFVSELFVFLGLFRTGGIGEGRSLVGASLGAPALALTGALALACFVKVLGAVFLGMPRTRHGERGASGAIHESPPSMLLPMAVLAAGCITLGLAPALAAPLLQQAIGDWSRTPANELPALGSLAPLGWISAANAMLVAISIVVLVGIVSVARRTSARKLSEMRTAGTWDCGFATAGGVGGAGGPSPRIQYTASSFAQMLVGLLRFVLRPREHRPHLHTPFPQPPHGEGGVGFKSHVDDLVLDGWVLPAIHRIERCFMRLRVLQYGRAQLYVLYVLIALILMLLATFPIHELLFDLLSR